MCEYYCSILLTLGVVLLHVVCVCECYCSILLTLGVVLLLVVCVCVCITAVHSPHIRSGIVPRLAELLGKSEK